MPCPVYACAYIQIVITGVGAVTPVGIGGDVAYKAMCEGKSGIVKLPAWADEYPAQVCYLLYVRFPSNNLTFLLL